MPGQGPDQAPGRRGDLARPGADDPQAGRRRPARGLLDSSASAAAAAASSSRSRCRPRRPTAPRRAPPVVPSRLRPPTTATATATAGAAATAAAPRQRPTAGRQRLGLPVRQRPVGQPQVRRPRRQRLATPRETIAADAAWRRPPSTTPPWTSRHCDERGPSPAVPGRRPRPGQPPGPRLDDAARDSADAATAAGDAAPSTRNGGRRTRRPTNGGTAFAAAVHVEDSPAPCRSRWSPS